MKKARLLLLTCLIPCFLFGDGTTNKHPFFPSTGKPPDVIRKWARVLLTFDQNNDQETIELAFPATPQKDAKGQFVVTDAEGMTFRVSALNISNLGLSPIEKVNLQESMAFLLQALISKPGIKVVYKVASADPQNKSSSAAWVSENGTLTRLTVVEGKKFVFFIETDVTNPAFYNQENLQDTPAFKSDSTKDLAFVRSLALQN